MVAAGLLALSFFTLALGAPTADVFHVHDKRAAAPAGYTASGAADPDQILNLRIALKTDSAPLVEKLLDVSTPSSENYRNWLSKAQVRARSAFPPYRAWDADLRGPDVRIPGREAHGAQQEHSTGGEGMAEGQRN